MGKYDTDLDDYEERSGGYDGEQPKPGMYEAVLYDFEEHDTSDTALHWQFEITEEGPYTGFRSHAYSDMDRAKWKTDMILVAIRGGQKGKASADPAKKEKTLKAAKPVMLVLGKGEYDGEYRAQFRRVLPITEATRGKAAEKVEGGKKKKKGKGETDPWNEGSDS